MARRLIFIFLLFSLFFISNNVCYCADKLPTITLDQSESILDYLLNIGTSSTYLKDRVKTSTASGFMKYFNDNVAQIFYNGTNGECDSSSHFIVLCFDTQVLFMVTNATLSNTLGFVDITTSSSISPNYRVSYNYAIRIIFNGNNSFSNNGLYSNSYSNIGLFYNNGAITVTPSFDENMTTLNTPNLYYLGPKATSDVKFNGSWYFLEYFYGGDTPPSGDTPTPSGDTPTPSGDTPNYNDKLDNISGLIGNTNTKLDGISGEIGQTNNKLDGISGELGEINNNLTTVPDLSGTTINSGDIESALNFNFAEDPYSNFWLQLTTGLSSALTGNKRSITINFRNKTYIISLDDFALQVPEFLKSFLAIISTTLVVWQIVRYIKIIIDKISSGDMDSVLAMNEEERNC